MSVLLFYPFITDQTLQLPKCSRFPGPCSVLVMDNARIHHGEEILELAETFGPFLHPIPVNFTLIFCKVLTLFFSHHTCWITTPSRKHSPRSKASSAATIHSSLLLPVCFTLCA